MIVFIIGPSGTGKTHIRREVFPDCRYVDVFEYQQKWIKKEGNIFESFAKADEEAINDFTKMAANMAENEIIVFESTLANSDRRKRYVTAVREAIPEDRKEKIVCLIASPLTEDIPELQKRKLEALGLDVSEKTVKAEIKAYSKLAMERMEYYMSFNGEGFDSVMRIIPMLHSCGE